MGEAQGRSIPADADAALSGRSRAGRHGWLRWALCLGWAALLWILLTADSGDGAPPPEWLALFARLAEQFAQRGGDKLVHAGLFFIQGALLVRAIAFSVVDRLVPAVHIAVAAALATTFYGVVTEFAQWLGGARVAEFGDGLANALGACLAALLWWRRQRFVET